MWKALLYIILAILLLASCRPSTTEPVVVTGAPVALPTVNFPPPTPPVVGGGGTSLPTPTLAGGAPAPAAAADPTETAGPVATAPTKDAHIVPQPPPTVTRPPDSAARYRLGAGPGVPPELVAAAQATAAANPDLFAWQEPGGEADVVLSFNAGANLATWTYAVAAPFATVADGTSFASVRTGYDAGSSELGTLLLDGETAAVFAALWGSPSPAQVIGDDLAGALWAARPSWTLIPFHRLQSELKVLAVDGRSPLAQGPLPEGDLLTMSVGAAGDEEAVAALLDAWQGPTTNRDPNKLTRVAMTGVTALVRATASQMEQNGVLYPGEEVAAVLQSADIAHISNEVSFAPDCPFPDPYGGTIFCSADKYFELLKHLGTDVIELTGNHVNDWGRDDLLRSIDMYEEAGMQWFGGGRDGTDAARAALFEHNGNRIAFVGCNGFGPNSSFADGALAGSRPCDPSLEQQIAQLKAEGAVVIATLQYTEYYQYPPTGEQAADFARLAAAGADAVSGSQGHHAQSITFADGAFIHYGLGNLFFDQMDMMGTRQTFVDNLIVYDGRLLAVDLWTGLIENWARPRLMTQAEREDLLRTIFQAAGW
jgi:poly-gamma-glutamate synthesis protein (capsule biosynthesis protein)